MKALLAVDLSKESMLLAEDVCFFGSDQLNEIILLHVIELDHYRAGGSLLQFETADREILARASESLEKVGFKVQTIIEQGDAVEKISQVAQDRSVDMIVITNIGRGGLSGRLLGSTAENLAKQSKLPIFIGKIVKKNGELKCCIEENAFRKILIGVDFSPASRNATEFIDNLSGVEAINLIHVVTAKTSDDKVNKLLDDLAAWKAMFKNIKRNRIEVKVLFGFPEKMIESEAYRWGASSIAVGLCSHGKIERMVWESISANIAKHVSLPIIIVPPNV